VVCVANIAPDQLIEWLVGDLDNGFEQVVCQYQHRLFAFTLRMAGDARDAEEIVQDAFVRAYRALRGYAPERIMALALRPWLYQITLNLCRNHARGKRLRLTPFQVQDGDETRRDAAPEPEDEERTRPEPLAEQAEQGAALAALLTTLPARYRAAVILRHVEGMSYAEAAEVLCQPVGTVKGNVHRGVALLRAAWLAQNEEVGNGQSRPGAVA
jgi:RNA polymerase sigma-70 factor (ECF subfamily)